MFQNDLLNGKRILITGGGSGLGRNMARRFMELGGELVICGRREDVLDDTAKQLAAETGGSITAHRLDIRDPEAVDETVGAIWQEGPVDILVNNAAGNFLARTETLSHRALDAVINIVLHGTSYMTLACGKRWIEEGRKGNVLSIVTTYAWTGSAYVVPSAMGKAGVLAMTRSLAIEWGPKGIRLNAIAPGAFPTEGAWSRLVPDEKMAEEYETRNPLGRPGRHDELENLAVYLASDQSEYITGEVVTIDGGDWIGGAGQFNYGAKLSNADWEKMKGK